MRDLKNKVQEQLWDCIKSSVFCVRFVHSSPNIFRDNHHFISARMDIYTKQSVIIFIFMCILHASNINTRHNYSAGLNFDRYVWFQSILFLGVERVYWRLVGWRMRERVVVIFGTLAWFSKDRKRYHQELCKILA